MARNDQSVPAGTKANPPVPISFPNVEGFPRFTIVDIFGLNHDTGMMEKVGEGRVSSNGKMVDSIGGVVSANSWHGFVPQPPEASAAPDPEINPKKDPDDQCEISGSSRFLLQNGELYEDHFTPGYRSLGRNRSLRFVYKNTSADPRPILSVDSRLGNTAPPPQSVSTAVSLDGVELAGEFFGLANLESNGTVFSRMSRQIDASMFPTGVYSYDFRINCNFPVSRRTEVLSGRLVVENQKDSVFGSGWTLDGLHRLYETPQGEALICEGDGED